MTNFANYHNGKQVPEDFKLFLVHPLQYKIDVLCPLI
jgi:hypothetical protein